MPNISGNNYSATDANKRAPGTRVNAGVRRFSNYVDLAVEGGGTTNPLEIADIPPGAVFDSITVASTVNLSAINFIAGPASDTDKYMTATAGPNATVKQGMGLPAMRKMDPLTEQERVLLTPSAAWPANGIVEVSFYASKE